MREIISIMLVIMALETSQHNAHPLLLRIEGISLLQKYQMGNSKKHEIGEDNLHVHFSALHLQEVLCRVSCFLSIPGVPK